MLTARVEVCRDAALAHPDFVGEATDRQAIETGCGADIGGDFENA